MINHRRDVVRRNVGAIVRRFAARIGATNQLSGARGAPGALTGSLYNWREEAFAGVKWQMTQHQASYFHKFHNLENSVV